MSKGMFSLMVLVIFLLAPLGAVNGAQWANSELLLSADDVKNNIDKPDWVVVDCRDLEDYVEGHIPGAISLGKNCKKAFRDATSRVLRDTSKYEKLLGKAGISNDTHVVFYGGLKDDAIKNSTVGFWVLEYIGHDKVHVLNGGIDAWRKAGYRLDKEPTIKPEKTFKVKNIRHNILAETDEILQIAKGKKKGVQMIDSRSKKEHDGEDIRALRGGHVPNTTINVSHLDTFDQEKDPKTDKDKPTSFISPDRVSELFKSLDKNKRTIAYCQTGTRSTLTYLELRLLGFKDPANWDESWVVWGSHYADYPIEAPNGEHWLNLEKVGKTEKKVKELEKALKELKEKVLKEEK
jgi:thiosulfate/3-mercaptopyruvate sulfurtransferase